MSKIRPKPLNVVFRQAPSLKQRLVKSSLKVLPYTNLDDVEIEPPGCYKFPHGRMGRPCVTCPRINVSISFFSSYTKMKYRMRHRLSCKSSYVIYLVTCTRPCDPAQGDRRKFCDKQYTGSTTTTMASRHSSHKTEIKDKSTPLGRHFSQCGIEHFSLQIIDCVKEGEQDALEILEGFWMHKLATFQVHGNLNKRDEMTRSRRN